MSKRTDTKLLGCLLGLGSICSFLILAVYYLVTRYWRHENPGGWLLPSVLVCLGSFIVAAWLSWGFWNTITPVHYTREEVADIIEAFINGTGGPHDWDDFCTFPLDDIALDQIRER